MKVKAPLLKQLNKYDTHKKHKHEQNFFQVPKHPCYVSDSG